MEISYILVYRSEYVLSCFEIIIGLIVNLSVLLSYHVKIRSCENKLQISSYENKLQIISQLVVFGACFPVYLWYSQ